MTTYSDVYKEAKQAAKQALAIATPNPMVVTGGDKDYFVGEGLCGFAWVNVSIDARTQAGKAFRELGAESNYNGGWEFSFRSIVPEYRGQSVERMRSACEAFAGVLNDWGFEAKASYRLD